MMATTHKVPVEEQKVHHVPDHAWRFQPLLLGPGHHKVSPEPSGLLDVCEGRVEDRRAVQWDVGEGRGAVGTGSMIVLPFVEVVSAAFSEFQGARQVSMCHSRHVSAGSVIRNGELLVLRSRSTGSRAVAHTALPGGCRSRTTSLHRIVAVLVRRRSVTGTRTGRGIVLATGPAALFRGNEMSTEDLGFLLVWYTGNVGEARVARTRRRSARFAARVGRADERRQRAFAR